MMCDYELDELGRKITDKCGEISQAFCLECKSRDEYVDIAVGLSELVHELVALTRDFCDGADAWDAMDWAEGVSDPTPADMTPVAGA